MVKIGADLWSELGGSDEKAVALADLAVGYTGRNRWINTFGKPENNLERKYPNTMKMKAA